MALSSNYRGRLAPTPSGPLHVGHARTFWTAHERARAAGGTLILRNEDLDPDRCQSRYARQMVDDLRWFGFTWSEGPDVGGRFSPYVQSERLPHYLEAWRALAAGGWIYPSPHSRKDIAEALVAPHGDEPIFPRELRPAEQGDTDPQSGPGTVNWRFRVPDGETIAFVDGRLGAVRRMAGVDFGDFLVWRKDGYPSYELAVVCDDHAMRITEVVRGEDLLTSTARQLLLYRAFAWQAPAFFHCPLVLDAEGRRLAKRTDAVSLAAFRERGETPESIRAGW